jgi:norsolorinic acid ketoreductase
MGAKLEDMGFITTEESAIGVLAVVDKATKETHGGKFFNNLGEELLY